MLKPEDVNLVIAHGNCPDGLGAAWTAHTLHRDKIEYYFANYGSEEVPEVKGKNVLMVDFAYKSIELMNKLNADANSMLLLDHHQSARENLEGKIDCDHIFDMDRSGARMAWDYFYPNKEVPEIIKYIEDRDIWKWEYPESRAYLASLNSYPQTFDTFYWASRLNDKQKATFILEGNSIIRFQKTMVDDAVKKALPGFLHAPDGKHRFPCFFVNSTQKELISDIGHTLSSGKIIGVIWSYNYKHDKISCSLRSKGDTDVSKIAGYFGGGGHKNASGFEVSGVNPNNILEHVPLDLIETIKDLYFQNNAIKSLSV